MVEPSPVAVEERHAAGDAAATRNGPGAEVLDDPPRRPAAHEVVLSERVVDKVRGPGADEREVLPRIDDVDSLCQTREQVDPHRPRPAARHEAIDQCPEIRPVGRPLPRRIDLRQHLPREHAGGRRVDAREDACQVAQVDAQRPVDAWERPVIGRLVGRPHGRLWAVLPAVDDAAERPPGVARIDQRVHLRVGEHDVPHGQLVDVGAERAAGERQVLRRARGAGLRSRHPVGLGIIDPQAHERR